jgi:hypothetical protein
MELENPEHLWYCSAHFTPTFDAELAFHEVFSTSPGAGSMLHLPDPSEE